MDRAAVFWRTHVRRLFLPLFAYQLLNFSLLKVFEVVSRTYFPLLRGGAEAQRLAESEPTVVFEQLALASAAGFTMTLAYVWLSWILSVGGTRFIVDTVLDRGASVESGLRRLLQRLGSTSAAFFLSLLWGLLAGVLCMLPGAALTGLGLAIVQSTRLGLAFVIAGMLLWLLGALVAFVWYAVRFMLTAEVLAMEEGGPLRALRRSGELVSGRLGPGFFNIVKVRAAIVVTVSTVITLVMGLVTSLPTLAVQQLYGRVFDPARANPDAIPQVLLVPAQLVQVAAQAALLPLTLAFGALFYLDMRVRREGLDIELKLGGTPR